MLYSPGKVFATLVVDCCRQHHHDFGYCEVCAVCRDARRLPFRHNARRFSRYKKPATPQILADKVKRDVYKRQGITLLHGTYKVLSDCINSRLAKYSKEIIGEYHCGFQPNRLTFVRMFTLRQIQEK